MYACRYQLDKKGGELMKEKTVYIAKNGREFKTKAECHNYEIGDMKYDMLLNLIYLHWDTHNESFNDSEFKKEFMRRFVLMLSD